MIGNVAVNKFLQSISKTMRCSISFLGVIFLVVGVSTAALIIIWLTEERCSETSFRCEEDGQCIAKRYFCDKNEDCKNGSDEYPIKCKDFTNTEDWISRIGKCKDITPPTNDSDGSEYFSLNCHLRFIRESIFIFSANVFSLLIVLQYDPKTADETQNFRMPESCYKKERNVVCNESNWKVIPWGQFGKNILTLTLDGVLETDELQSNNSPSEDNELRKLFIENNDIGYVADKSLCNLHNICWLFFENNTIGNFSVDALCHMEELGMLRLHKNRLHLTNFVFKEMPNLHTLEITDNEIPITVITEEIFSQLDGLITLNLARNKISFIHEKAFISNKLLIEIDLSYNRIKEFASFTFKGQIKLTKLVISQNPLVRLQKEVFTNLDSLVSLHLQGIQQDAIDISSFTKMKKLDVVEVDKFQFCRFIPQAARCNPKSDGVSSTEDLLLGKVLRMVVWVISLLTIIGNVMVLASRWYNRRGRILDVFINNLAGADFLMGVYLLVLAIKDAEYRFAYNNHAYSWSTSFLCSAIGILAMVSSEVSLLILTLMSLERYLVISVPFSHRRKLTVMFARLSVAIIWVFVIGLALTPALQWQGKYSFYGSTGLCFPLHLDDAYSIGWQYTAFVFIGLNSTCLALITFSYGKLFYIVRNTRKNTPMIEVNKDMEMAFRFFLMVFTDLLCWTPIIILKIVVMSGYRIPNEVITWVLLLVLPFSSMVNPFLYTFSTGEVRMKLMRIFPCRRAMGIVERENDVRLNAVKGTTATDNSRSNIQASNGTTHTRAWKTTPN